MTNKYTAERLMQVVRVLDELPKEKKFNLSTWGHCGTVACAVGWAGLDPWFRRRKFVSRKNKDGQIWLSFRGSGPDIWGRCSEIQKFFGINLPQIENLFFPQSYKRGAKRDVIRRIRKFVREECR